MLALHYYSNSEGVRTVLRQVASAWWSQEDDDPVYSKDLIKEFEVESPPLEDELAWILFKGTKNQQRRTRANEARNYSIIRAKQTCLIFICNIQVYILWKI